MIEQIADAHSNTALDGDATIMERYRREQPWGLAASIDLQGCNPALIRSAEHIRSFVDAPCTLIEMKKYGRPPLEWENVEPIAPEPE